MTERFSPQLLSDKPLELTRHRLCDCLFCHVYAYTSEYRLNDPEYVRHWCYKHNRWWKRVIYHVRQSEKTPHVLATTTLVLFGLLLAVFPFTSLLVFLILLLGVAIFTVIWFIGGAIYRVLVDFFQDLF
jgi:hypothetical protein